MDAGRADGAGGEEHSASRLAGFFRQRALAISKGPVDGGQGGKLGHSNMTHWDYTEEIKTASRKWRRLKAKHDVAEGLMEYQHQAGSQNNNDLRDELPQ